MTEGRRVDLSRGAEHAGLDLLPWVGVDDVTGPGLVDRGVHHGRLTDGGGDIDSGEVPVHEDVAELTRDKLP